MPYVPGVKDYAHWYYAHKRMEEIIANPANPPEFVATTVIRRDRYASNMAEYEAKNGRPTRTQIKMNRPIIGNHHPKPGR